MNIVQSIENALRGGAKWMSFTYTAKKHGETARYTMLLGAYYLKACEDDLLELELRLKEAKGIEAIVIADKIQSLKESLLAAKENRFHRDYKKPGLYADIVNSVQIAKNDLTLEVKGFVYARKVLIPGNYPRLTPQAQLKAKILKGLKTQNYRTLCLDVGHMHSARINGEVIELD